LQIKAFENALKSNLIPWLRGCHMDKRNPKLNSSILDCMLKYNAMLTYLEIKSAVLRGKNVTMYPDRVSLRERRLIKELINIVLKCLNLTELLTEIYELIREATKVGVMVEAMGIFFNPYNSTIMLENPDLKVII